MKVWNHYTEVLKNMKSIKDLQAIRQRTLEEVNLRNDRHGIRVVVGMGTCGIAAGARPVMMEFVEEIKRRNISDAIVTQTGCIGVCRLEPMVEVFMPGQDKVTYVLMDAEKVAKIVGEHLINGKPVTEYTIGAAQ